jgi:hypothetical protein
LLAVLKTLPPQDWERVEACADTVDRLLASAAARAAMAVIGIHPTHELFVRATRELRLPERSRSWDIAADSLLAAAAWDGLEPAKRHALTECLAENDSVKRLLDSW